MKNEGREGWVGGNAGCEVQVENAFVAFPNNEDFIVQVVRALRRIRF